jgi:DNA end-binding protein Ku
VPVKVYSATKDHDVHFHQFEEGTGDRIRYQRVNERTGKEVDFGDIVKGAEVSDGDYVMLDPDELDSVAPGRSRSLDIHTFVEQSEIDPIYYQKTYYLGPGSDETVRTYALLRDAMADADRVAIGTLVMRGKEYLAAIRPDRDLLVLETMFFADEIRDPAKEVGDLPAKTSGKQLKMATDLIEAMAGEWRPKDYKDTYTERVKKLVATKRKGKEVVFTEEEPEATSSTDLVSALRASVEAARARRAGGGAKKTAAKKSTAKKSPAKKSTTKKTAAKKTTTKKSTTKKSTSKKKAA